MALPTDRGELRRVTRRLLAIGQWIAQRETLPQTDPTSLHPRSVPNAIGWLTHKDFLPPIQPPIQPHRRFLSWLITPERLPAETPGREQLAGSILRWFFTSETLTITQSPNPTKEASSDEP